MSAEFSSRDFLEGYVAAFERLDAGAVSSFYHAPCLSVRADGSVHAFAGAREIEAFFASVLAAYAAEGMATFAASDVVEQAMGGAARHVECTWTMKRADDGVIREWRQSYIVLPGDDRWKIAASIFHL